MVKVESGLFNELKGTLEKSRTTFQTRKSGIVAEKKPIPPKDARGRRECIRWIYRYLCDKWNTLSEQEKQLYDETAEKHNITLFNAFLKEELTKRLWKCKLAKLDGQVLYLPLVEGEGNVAKDFSGFNNDGIVYGATWVSGKFGHALSFDGVDDYVESTNISLLQPFSLMAWINPFIVTGFRTIISKTGTSVSDTNYWMDVRLNGRLAFGVYSSNEAPIYLETADYTVNAYEWAHVAGTYDGTIFKVYVNGVKRPKTLSWSGTIKTNNYNTRIGYRGLFGHPFKGIIALPMIFNRALSQEEIAKIYETTRKYFK